MAEARSQAKAVLSKVGYKLRRARSQAIGPVIDQYFARPILADQH